MNAYKTKRWAAAILASQCAGCIILTPRSVVVERISGVASLHATDGQVTLESVLHRNGTPVMQTKGKPTGITTIRVGESVHLPVFNGRADYRLKSVGDTEIKFTADEWFWACTGPFLIHRTSHVTVAPYDHGHRPQGAGND